MTTSLDKYKKLDQNIIKLIAIFAMTLDYLAWFFYPGYQTAPIAIILHIVGRITAPVMCFCIAEGYHYSKNLNKYTIRLFVFAFISHFAYVFFRNDFKTLADLTYFIPFYHGKFLDQTSVMFSLAIGLVMLRVVNYEKFNKFVKTFLVLLLCLVSFPSDWSCIGSLCVLFIGSNRNKFRNQMLWMVFFVFIYAIVYFFILDKIYAIIQLGVILAIPILFLYNGQRGKNRTINSILKWFFYLYYPLHLFILGLIQFLL